MSQRVPPKWLVVERDGSYREVSLAEVPAHVKRDAMIARTNRLLIDRVNGVTPSSEVIVDPASDPNVGPE